MNGGLPFLIFGNLFAIALLNLIEWLCWHNHHPFFVVTRALALKKWLFLVLLVLIWILAQLISYFVQRSCLCEGRIKLLKQESGM